MDVTVLLFDGVTALDAIGPCDALARLPDVHIAFCARTRGLVRSQDGFVGLQADRSLFDVEHTDVLLVPGGSRQGLAATMSDAAVLQALARLHATTTWTASVCTGSLILGAAGITKGLAVATHWRAQAFLPRVGTTYSGERVSRQGRLVTAAGVTAGIDLGLVLCGLIAGPELAAAVELSMEYCPEPPFGGVKAVDASADLREAVETRLRG